MESPTFRVDFRTGHNTNSRKDYDSEVVVQDLSGPSLCMKSQMTGKTVFTHTSLQEIPNQSKAREQEQKENPIPSPRVVSQVCPSRDKLRMSTSTFQY